MSRKRGADGFSDVETERLDADDLARPRWLVVLTPASSQVVPLVPGRSLRIGRAADCDVVVVDTSVSRQHATLHVGATLEVEDEGSANGVLVSGMRVPAHERVALNAGAVLQIGAVTLLVQSGAVPPRLESEPERTAPPATGTTSDRDESMVRLYATAARVARTPIAVLIVGETGVGKELLAASVHEHSPRAGKPFVTINCAALPAHLQESELFGHERGAFTGADRAKPGLLESADRGTLFLDEVGEMSLDLQAKLLRVLEDRRVRRVGATVDRSIDVRFVAATNRDLEAAVAAGTFRRDLFYRLKGIVLEIPPLRARKGEIATLARTFLAAAAGDRPLTLTAEAEAALRAHDWPGNVRELRQAMEHAAALSDGPWVEPAHLPREVLGARSVPEPAAGAAGLRDDLAAIEKRRILDALAACDGNQTRAAEMLGMPRRTLITRIEQYGLPRPRKDR